MAAPIELKIYRQIALGLNMIPEQFHPLRMKTLASAATSNFKPISPIVNDVGCHLNTSAPIKLKFYKQVVLGLTKTPKQYHSIQVNFICAIIVNCSFLNIMQL